MGLEKPTDNSWHNTCLRLAELWIVGAQKSTPETSIENDREGR